jgi:hypothetical protein
MNTVTLSSVVEKQRESYREIMKMNVINGLELALKKGDWDYYIDHDRDGVYYLVPNNTNRSIVALSHRLGVAAFTGFYNLDDFYEGSDYNFVSNGSGALVPAFMVGEN